MTAFRPEDIVEILAGIYDQAEFNSQPQRLLFDTLIPNWHNLDAREQTYLMQLRICFVFLMLRPGDLSNPIRAGFPLNLLYQMFQMV